MEQRSIKGRFAVAGVALGLLATAAACGGDNSGGSSATTGAATTAAAATTTAAGGATTTAAAATTTAAGADLDAKVAALLEADLDFPMPTEPVTPGTHEIAIVTAGLASPGPATVAANAKDALAAIGWTAPDAYDGKFTPTEQSALIEKAVQDGADAIILVAITPSAVSAAVASATNAGIPLVCVLCGPVPEGMISAEADPELSAEAQAAYVVANSPDDATFVVYQNAEFANSQQQMIKAADLVKEYCPGCTVEEPSLLLAEARQPNAPIFTSLLGDHPEGDLNYVLLPFDSPSGALANTASQLGRSDFGIVGFGALSPYVDMVGAGTPAVAKASVTIPTPFLAWVAVDQAARAVAGQEPWNSAKMPVGLITKENFSSYPAGQPYVSPKGDYKAEFTKLWGK